MEYLEGRVKPVYFGRVQNCTNGGFQKIYDELELAHECVVYTLLFGLRGTSLVSSQSYEDKIRQKSKAWRDRYLTWVEHCCFRSIEDAIVYFQLRHALVFERFRTLCPSINKIDEAAEQSVFTGLPQTGASLREAKLGLAFEFAKVPLSLPSLDDELQDKFDDTSDSVVYYDASDVRLELSDVTYVVDIVPIKNSQAAELAELKANHASELKEGHANHAADILDLKAKLEDRVNVHSAEVKDIEADYTSQLKGVNFNHASENSGLKANLAN